MDVDQVVLLGRSMLQEVVILAGPILAVAIFVSLLVHHPMTILFSNFELIALTAAVGIAVLISMDGKSHWLEGAQLLAVYVIVAMAFYYVAG